MDSCPGGIVTGNVSWTTCREHGEGTSPLGALDTHKLLSSLSVPASHVKKKNSPDRIKNSLTLQGACGAPKPGHGLCDATPLCDPPVHRREPLWFAAGFCAGICCPLFSSPGSPLVFGEQVPEKALGLKPNRGTLSSACPGDSRGAKIHVSQLPGNALWVTLPGRPGTIHQ